MDGSDKTDNANCNCQLCLDDREKMSKDYFKTSGNQNCPNKCVCHKQKIKPFAIEVNEKTRPLIIKALEKWEKEKKGKGVEK